MYVLGVFWVSMSIAMPFFLFLTMSTNICLIFIKTNFFLLIVLRTFQPCLSIQRINSLFHWLFLFFAVAYISFVLALIFTISSHLVSWGVVCFCFPWGSLMHIIKLLTWDLIDSLTVWVGNDDLWKTEALLSKPFWILKFLLNNQMLYWAVCLYMWPGFCLL